MKIATAMLGIFSIMIISGCTSQPACNPPYIIKEGQCCLDQNNNKICDSDEAIGNVTSPIPQKNYQQYEVKMYVQQDSPDPDSWYKLPPSPYKNYDGYQIFSYPQDAAYYDGGWFLLYTKYMEEPIECMVKEYYDSVLYTQSAVKLIPKGYSGNVSGVSVRQLFAKDVTPKLVRYEINCTGDQSGITFKDAYLVGLRPP